MDIHVGQSYSFLVTMDQNASTDYYIVASPRFVNSSWAQATGVSILHYANSQGLASGPLPSLSDQDNPSFSINQARSIRLLFSSLTPFLFQDDYLISHDTLILFGKAC